MLQTLSGQLKTAKRYSHHSGRGVFADEIREQGVIGTAAHFMAIAAMDQYGWLLSTYGIPVTITPAIGTGPRILLPYDHMLQLIHSRIPGISRLIPSVHILHISYRSHSSS